MRLNGKIFNFFTISIFLKKIRIVINSNKEKYIKRGYLKKKT